MRKILSYLNINSGDHINKKYLYMLFLFVVIIGSLVIRSTYAKFTSGYTTEDDIVGLNFDFNIGISNIEEYNEIKVKAGENEVFNVEITNSTSNTMYYGVWYRIPDSGVNTDSIVIARLEGTDTTTSGSIDASGTKTVTIIIINSGEVDITFEIGVSSDNNSTNNIEYIDGRKLISGTAENPTITPYIVDLYNDGSTINTVYIGGDSSNPQVNLNATQGIMLDNNGDYRYYGANPNNYVTFNGETWRIIGVFNNVDDGTGTKETRLKIIRNESIGSYSYDSSASTVNDGFGVNDWSKSDLNSELNTLYYNSTSGTCYKGDSNASTTCDFSSTGLGNDSRSMIDNAIYYLGGSSSYKGLYADDYYTFERGTTVYGCSTDDGACPRATTWTGKIGLMYPSDYVYATDLSVCTSDGYNYGNTTCTGNDWLFNSEFQWTIVPFPSDASDVFAVFSGGDVGDTWASNSPKVRPAAYLKSNVAIVSGEGTSSNPYQLELS